MQQFSQKDKDNINAAKTFIELRNIVIPALEKFDEPIVQLCGPLTTGGAGSYEANMKEFTKAYNHLHKHGQNVFDLPTLADPIDRIIASYTDHEKSLKELLEDFFGHIFASGHIIRIYFLPDWQSSNGASGEYKEAKKLSIPTTEMPKNWTENTSYIE